MNQDFNYNSIITMSSSEFRNICKNLYAIDDRVIIEINKNYIKFYVDEEDIKGGFTLESNNSNELDNQCIIRNDRLIKLNYNLKYLFFISKASSIAQQICIHIS